MPEGYLDIDVTAHLPSPFDLTMVVVRHHAPGKGLEFIVIGRCRIEPGHGAGGVRFDLRPTIRARSR